MFTKAILSSLQIPILLLGLNKIRNKSAYYLVSFLSLKIFTNNSDIINKEGCSLVMQKENEIAQLGFEI